MPENIRALRMASAQREGQFVARLAMRGPDTTRRCGAEARCATLRPVDGLRPREINRGGWPKITVVRNAHAARQGAMRVVAPPIAAADGLTNCSNSRHLHAPSSTRWRPSGAHRRRRTPARKRLPLPPLHNRPPHVGRAWSWSVTWERGNAPSRAPGPSTARPDTGRIVRLLVQHVTRRRGRAVYQVFSNRAVYNLSRPFFFRAQPSSTAATEKRTRPCNCRRDSPARRHR